MSGLAFVAIVALMGFAVGKGRKDVVFTVGGYLMAALFVTIGLIFGSLYLYTNFLYDLWTKGMN